ncbi:MAG TPA: tetratricopeptide repeat protein [Candidatus Angelobacter sp.]
MVRLSACLLTLFLLSAAWAQHVDVSSDRSVQVSHNASASTKPTLTASPPDAPMPDLGSVPGPSNASKPLAKRVLDQLVPRCLDAMFHICWAQPPGGPPVPPPKPDHEFTRNMEVANLYFADKNWAGAESRLREALAAQPTSPEATFKLARSLDRLGKSGLAREMYQKYLSLQPNGPYAKEATQSLAGPAKQGKKR